jgi:hypothetical protein
MQDEFDYEPFQEFLAVMGCVLVAVVGSGILWMQGIF